MGLKIWPETANKGSTLVLSALVTCEIERYLRTDEDAVLEAIAAEHVLEDPEAFLDYLGRLMAAEAAEAKQEAS